MSDKKMMESNPKIKRNISKKQEEVKSKFQESKINSFEEFVKKVEEYSNQGFTFFRGDKSSKVRTVSPKAYWNDNNDILKYHDVAIEEFGALSVGKHKISSDDFFEVMVNAQHYDYPTRLLDWTESALIALYFSVYNADKTEDDSVVLLLNPLKLNLSSELFGSTQNEDYNKIPMISPEENKDLSISIKQYYLKNDSRPIAIKTRKINPRIDVQRGVFVLFPLDDNKKGLSEYNESDKYLYKINIENGVARKLLKQLQVIGITQYTIFPEVNSIALDIKEKYIGGK